MKRGDLVTVAVAGDYGKPRPAVIIQSDMLMAVDSVLVVLVSSFRIEAPLYRLAIAEGDLTGLRQPSDIMVEKIIAVPRAKLGAVIGRLDAAQMLALNQMLAFVTGLADRPAS
jgi:mRNA interferase MazF